MGKPLETESLDAFRVKVDELSALSRQALAVLGEAESLHAGRLPVAPGRRDAALRAIRWWLKRAEAGIAAAEQSANAVGLSLADGKRITATNRKRLKITGNRE